MRIAICDDDNAVCVLTVRMVRAAFEARGILAEVEGFFDAASLLKVRASGTVFDAYILDILMPKTNGIELARTLRETQPKAPIVFLTTTRDFTFEAYSFDAINYLEKPLESARLETALDRLLALLPKSEEENLLVKTSDGEAQTVAVEKIVLAESDGHYWCLRLADGQQVRIRISAGELWERLSATGRFVQAGRGVILGVAAVRSLVAAGAVLADGSKVSVSRRALPELRKAYLRFNCR